MLLSDWVRFQESIKPIPLLLEGNPVGRPIKQRSAPKARALKMSVPLLIPLSNRIRILGWAGRRALTISGNASRDDGLISSWRPTGFDTQINLFPTSIFPSSAVRFLPKLDYTDWKIKLSWWFSSTSHAAAFLPKKLPDPSCELGYIGLILFSFYKDLGINTPIFLLTGLFSYNVGWEQLWLTYSHRWFHRWQNFLIVYLDVHITLPHIRHLDG